MINCSCKSLTKFKPKINGMTNFVDIDGIRKFAGNQVMDMADIKITAEEWDVLQKKFRRKYNNLSDDDLAFEPGKEDELIGRLARRVRRTPDYVLFTLKKGLADLAGNRL